MQNGENIKTMTFGNETVNVGVAPCSRGGIKYIGLFSFGSVVAYPNIPGGKGISILFINGEWATEEQKRKIIIN